ncbi:MAG: stage III sporulation protein AF [Desulfotomaculales bacterium]
MEALRTLVRELAVIAILFVFLELLLPAGDIRRYVRMVLGLVIIVVVLHAFASFGWRGLDRELAALRIEGGKVDDDALARGRKLWEENQARALAAYGEGLEKQIQALGRLSGEVNVAEAQVVMESEGRIKEVVITVEQPRLRDREVAVSGEPKDDSLDEVVARVRQTIADFYDLDLKQIKVVYR